MQDYKTIVQRILHNKMNSAIKDFYDSCDSPAFQANKSEKIDSLRATKRAHGIILDIFREVDKKMDEESKISFQGGITNV